MLQKVYIVDVDESEATRVSIHMHLMMLVAMDTVQSMQVMPLCGISSEWAGLWKRLATADFNSLVSPALEVCRLIISVGSVHSVAFSGDLQTGIDNKGFSSSIYPKESRVNASYMRYISLLSAFKVTVWPIDMLFWVGSNSLTCYSN